MRRKNAHHRALPNQEVGVALEAVEGPVSNDAAKLCFRLLVLTAARSGEARGEMWGEVDLRAREWRIPAELMKAHVQHSVPLSGAAILVLEQALTLRDGSDLVFPSPVKRARPLSDMTLMKVLRRVGLAQRTTVHGLRASFRTWASECTDTDHAVMELSLAHSVGSAVEQAYARSDLLDKRRRLMDQWAAFVTRDTAEASRIRG